jgi:2-aminobenzoate-CoA ligase
LEFGIFNIGISNMKHYTDNFAHDNLPSIDLQPDYLCDLPQFQHPEMLNCVERLLDNHIKKGNGDAVCIRTFEESLGLTIIYSKKPTKLLTYLLMI